MQSSSGKRSFVRTVSVSNRRGKRAKVVSVPRSVSTRGTFNGVHEFKRVIGASYAVTNSGITLGATTSTLGSIQFNLSSVIINNTNAVTLNIPSYTELSALFDQVKLAKVIVRMRSRNDSSMGAANAAIEIASCVDFNEADVPASQAVLQQYGTYKSTIAEPGGREHIISLKPQWLQLVNYTAILSGYASKTGYVRSDYDIPHYGLKFFIQGSATASQINLEFEYYYECKNVK